MSTTPLTAEEKRLKWLRRSEASNLTQSRNPNKALEQREESARKASEAHKEWSGHELRITHTVKDGNMTIQTTCPCSDDLQTETLTAEEIKRLYKKEVTSLIQARNSTRAWEKREKSARNASELHRQRTGRALLITRDAIKGEDDQGRVVDFLEDRSNQHLDTMQTRPSQRSSFDLARQPLPYGISQSPQAPPPMPTATSQLLSPLSSSPHSQADQLNDRQPSQHISQMGLPSPATQQNEVSQRIGCDWCKQEGWPYEDCDPYAIVQDELGQQRACLACSLIPQECIYPREPDSPPLACFTEALNDCSSQSQTLFGQPTTTSHGPWDSA